MPIIDFPLPIVFASLKYLEFKKSSLHKEQGLPFVRQLNFKFKIL